MPDVVTGVSPTAWAVYVTSTVEADPAYVAVAAGMKVPVYLPPTSVSVLANCAFAAVMPVVIELNALATSEPVNDLDAVKVKPPTVADWPVVIAPKETVST